MNNIDFNKIKELLSSKDRETISLGIEFLISDYSDLYNYIRNQYKDKKYFDTVIFNILHPNKKIISDSFLEYFIKTSIVFYIDSYIYENSNN